MFQKSVEMSLAEQERVLMIFLCNARLRNLWLKFKATHILHCICNIYESLSDSRADQPSAIID